MTSKAPTRAKNAIGLGQRRFRLPHMIERVETDANIHSCRTKRQLFAFGDERQLRFGEGQAVRIVEQQRIKANAQARIGKKMDQSGGSAADVQHAQASEEIRRKAEAISLSGPVAVDVKPLIYWHLPPVSPEVPLVFLGLAPAAV